MKLLALEISNAQLEVAIGLANQHGNNLAKAQNDVVALLQKFTEI